MDKRKIGSLEVTVVGLGCNNFGGRLDASRTKEVVDAALAAGINFFDTADIYGKTKSEEFLGQALGPRRKDIVIATKFGMKVDDARQGAKPDYVRRAADDSLRRLGTDWIDLYQLHQPDPSVPLADTLGALDELVRAGKVREIGCSNFSTEQVREAKKASGDRVRFVSVQNEYSLMHREPERSVLEECAREGLAFLPYFPLASGLLTGKYRQGRPAPEGSRLQGKPSSLEESNLAVVEKLVAFAQSRGKTILDLAISWLLRKPEVASVIAGATQVEQVQSNVHAAGWQFSAEDLAEIDKIVPAPTMEDK